MEDTDTQRMRRKLVKQGPSTLTVSLPSQWVKANKLKTGEEVLLAIEHNNVIISPDVAQSQEDAIHLNVRQLSKSMLGLLLSALHKKGFEEVQLEVHREQVEHIQNRISKNLLGYEIVQHTPDSVTIRFVTKIDADELPVLIRRAFLVTLSLAEGLANGVEGKELLVLEETNNRLTNYCERIIVKNIYHQKNAIFTYLLVWLLEKIADEYRDIIKRGRTDKPDAQICLTLLKQFYDLYYKYSYDRHDNFLQQLTQATDDLAKRNSPFHSVLVTLAQTGGSLIALNAQQSN